MDLDSNTNLLKKLLGFYQLYGNEVLGHENTEPDDETFRKIEQFVAGKLPENEMEAFFAAVADRPRCLALIAEKLNPSVK